MHTADSLDQAFARTKVQLRLWPQAFAQADWRALAHPAYRAYLENYHFATECTARAGWLALDSDRIWMQAFRPRDQAAQGTLVHLHGYYDHGASYPFLQRWCLAQQLIYCTVDLPGHGLSSGPRAAIDDFQRYQQLLNQVLDQLRRERWPRPWLLSGFSTGGAIALEHAMQQLQFDQLVLLAPLVRPIGWTAIRRWRPLLNLVVRSVPRKHRDNSHDQAYLDFVREQDALQPRRLPLVWVKALGRWIRRIEKQPPCKARVIIIQGDADTTVDWSYNLSVLHRLLPNAKTHLLQGARHQLLNESSEWQTQLAAHLLHWLKYNQ
ncbi:alpha/beta hydrolase [Marinospirillum sp. MEB164]|uniref:Alpha/beta hydrolase n=1 Tax=Marinospirillum alkalitolerans TaxID=3123374 RepID=A0ABW8PW23_9GAMM